MTPEEFKKEIESVKEKHGDDIQECHEIMDGVLCRCLIKLGYEEGIEIFQKTDKWYA